MNATAVNPVSEKKLRFIKEIKDYLCHSDLTEYDYKRIAEIYEKYDSKNIVYLDRIVEKTVDKPSVVLKICPRCVSKKIQRSRSVYYRISDIERVVCAYLNEDAESIKRPCRKPEKVLARGIIYHFAMRHTVMSMKSIGKRYGGRDHTTVLHGLKRMQDAIDTNSVVVSYMAEISEILKPYALKNDLTNILEE